MSSGNGTEATPSMRDKMPETAALIDNLREQFGADEVTRALQRGLKQGTFWAIEAGQVVGSPPSDARRRNGVSSNSPNKEGYEPM